MRIRFPAVDDVTDVPHQEFLFTVAQVAAAFVGFSLLVSVFKPAEGAERFFAMRDVAEISLGSVAFALAPYVLFQFEVHGEALWRVASIGMLLGWSAGLTLAFRRFASAERILWRDARVLFIGGSVLNVVGMLSLLWNAVLGGSWSAPRYLLALTLILGIAGLLFVWAAFSRERRTPEEGA